MEDKIREAFERLGIISVCTLGDEIGVMIHDDNYISFHTVFSLSYLQGITPINEYLYKESLKAEREINRIRRGDILFQNYNSMHDPELTKPKEKLDYLGIERLKIELGEAEELEEYEECIILRDKINKLK